LLFRILITSDCWTLCNIATA